MRSIRLTSGLRLVLALATLLFMSTLTNILISQSSSAANKLSSMGLEEKNKSTSYYITLQGCVQNNMLDTIKAETKNYSPKSINWFDDNNAYGYVYPDGKMDCKDIMATALGAWDISPDNFLKGIDYAQKNGTSYNWTGTRDGATRKGNFDSYIQTQLGTTDPGNPGQAAAYKRYSYWWDNECVVKKFGKYTDITDSVIKNRIDSNSTEKSGNKTVRYISVKRIGDTPWGYSYNYKTGYETRYGSTDKPFEFTAYGYHNSPRMVSCDDTATALTKYAGSYQEFTNEQAVEQVCRNMGYTTISASSANPVGVYTLGACKSGYANVDDLLYCTNTYKPKTFTYYGQQITNTQEAELKACGIGAEITEAQLQAAKEGILAAEQESLGATGSASEGSSCVIEGLGWIICPVINFLASIADGAFGFLADSFLRTDPVAFQTDSPTYQAWVIMRNIANVLFVIAFLFIIFSQLTGSGISNYGVKRMLPRIVIAAILVNTSFIISQLAVDLSNILGYSIRDVFGGITLQVRGDTFKDVASVAATGNSFTDIAVGILAFGGAAVALYALLSVFGAVVLTAALALIMILFILIARQAIIILLVVLSPIAFAAILLPNTENLFKFWRKTLTAMLLLFPIIALVFGASSLASTVLQGSFTGAYNEEGSNWFGQIVASAVLVIPLFVVPILLRKSLDGVPMLGQMANKWSSRANSKFGSAVGNSYKGSKFGRGRAVRRAAREEFRNQKYAQSLTQDGRRGTIARFTAGGVSSLGMGITRSQRAMQRAQRNAITGSARATVANADAKDLGDAIKVLDQDIATAQVQQGASFNKDRYLMGIAGSATATDTQKSAAMHQLASLGRGDQIRQLQTQFRSSSDTHSEENLNRAIQANAGALVGKAPDLVKGGTGPAFNTITGDGLAGFTVGTAQRHVEHIEQLYAAAQLPTATAADQQALDTAIMSFNSAVTDISSNPTLQARFGGDVGREYATHIAALAPALQGRLGAAAGIQSDGKIR